MIKVLKDNTQNIFFTKCKVCRSELAYRAEGRTKTACVILNRILEVVKREYYEKEVVI